MEKGYYGGDLSKQTEQIASVFMKRGSDHDVSTTLIWNMVSDSGELSVCLQQSSYSGFSFEVLKKKKEEIRKYMKTQNKIEGEHN